jgi:hypothetical protein
MMLQAPAPNPSQDNTVIATKRRIMARQYSAGPAEEEVAFSAQASARLWPGYATKNR